jgi:hypothetical protein
MPPPPHCKAGLIWLQRAYVSFFRFVLSRQFHLDLGSLDRVCLLFSDQSAYSNPIDLKKYLQISSKSRYFFDWLGIDRELGMLRSLVSILFAMFVPMKSHFMGLKKRNHKHIQPFSSLLVALLRPPSKSTSLCW